MSWMTPFPTRDTSVAPHWVAPGTPESPIGDYVAVCGTTVGRQQGLDIEYGPPRPECTHCTETAAYPYPGGEDR